MNSPFLTGLDWRPIARKGAKPARMPIGIPIALRHGRSLGGYAGLQGLCRSDPPSDLVWAARGGWRRLWRRTKESLYKKDVAAFHKKDRLRTQAVAASTKMSKGQ